MKSNVPVTPDPDPEVGGRETPSPAFGAVPSTARSSARWRWIIGIGIVALIAVFLLARGARGKEKQAQAAAKAQASRAVPVTALPTRTGDLGVYLNGLGTVTARNTVTVRSRVDGQLMRVNFREGQIVRAGELLAEIDARPFEVQLTQAEGQMAKDQATLQNAKLDLERYTVLLSQDAIPQQQLATQEATVRQLEASIRSDQGQIDSARLNITYSRITAPVSGRVGLRLVDQGNIVHATDANGLVVITQLQPITVIFTIPADHLPEVQAQLAAGRQLTVDAYDRDLKSRIATGALRAIDNQIDQTTGTVRLKAEFPNRDNALFPNQFVNARLLVDTLRGTVLAPAAAIQRSPQSTFVYVVKPDSTVELRTVDVGLTEGDDVAIRKGLSAGEQVVVDGVDKLQPGVKVATGSPATGSKRRAS